MPLSEKLKMFESLSVNRQKRTIMIRGPTCRTRIPFCRHRSPKSHWFQFLENWICFRQLPGLTCRFECAETDFFCCVINPRKTNPIGLTCCLTQKSDGNAELADANVARPMKLNHVAASNRKSVFCLATSEDVDYHPAPIAFAVNKASGVFDVWAKTQWEFR